MSVTRINFIGCGKLGKTIAKLLTLNNLVTIAGVLNSSLKSTTDATRFIGQGLPCETIQQLPPADIYFITVGDDSIERICNQLVTEGIFKSGAIVVHCSGFLSSDVLSKAKSAGCFIASIHPIKSFANPEQSIKDFAGTYCGLEGDENIKSLLANLFTSIGGIVFELDKKKKVLYHAAAVIASNYLVTLHHQAFECYKAAGVDAITSKKIVSMLMSNTLNNINNSDHEKALTGPIQRGDTLTVKGHITHLHNHSLTKSIYSTLGLATLPLTTHSDQKKSELQAVLNSHVENNELDNPNFV